ncbi:MAG TPA: hypothetical protein VFV60_01005, partial [bacterium]|nr:hypothetical protein [bacterium]
IVAKAMRRRKEERFADAGEIVAALRHPEQVGLSIVERPDPPLSSPVSESLIKNPLFVLGLVAVGTAVAVLIAEALLRR